MNTLIAQALAFAAAVLIVLTFDWTLRKARSKTILPEAAQFRPFFFEWFEGPIALLGTLTLPYVDAILPLKPARVRQDLLSAGLLGPLDVKQVVGAQMLSCLMGGMLGVLASLLIGAMHIAVLLAAGTGCLIGWAYPSIWLAKRAEARKQAIAKQLPYALDLLTTAIEAGQDFNAALRYLTRHGLTGPLAEELLKTLGEMDLGQSRQEALRKMVNRIPTDEMARLVSAVIQSMETGASLSGTMRMLSQDLRRMRFHRAERQAARAPSLMIIPMVLFIVPGIFIIVFTPVVLRVMHAMGKM